MAAACDFFSATATSSWPGRAGSSPCSAAGRCGSRSPSTSTTCPGSALATSGVVAALVAPGILFGSVAGVFRRPLEPEDDARPRQHRARGRNACLFSSVQDESWLWVVYPKRFPCWRWWSSSTGPAENAFLPRLVPAEELVAANSLNALNNNLARLGGPVGLSEGRSTRGRGSPASCSRTRCRFSSPPCCWVRIVASGAVAAAGDISEAAGRRWRRVWSELHDGLGVVRRSRPVGVVFGAASITSFGEGIFAVMFAVWVQDFLEGGVPDLGLLQTSQAVGGLLGGVARRLRRAPLARARAALRRSPCSSSGSSTSPSSTSRSSSTGSGSAAR